MAETTIYATEDAHTNEGAGDSNYGTPDYYLFDVSGLPEGQTIDSAVLHLKVFQKVDSGITGNIYRVTASWAENSITYNSEPSDTGTPESNTIDMTSVADCTATITTLVQGWYDGTYNSYGIKVANDSAGAGDLSYARSSEYGTQADRPKIIINYSPEVLFIPKVKIL